MSGSGKHEIKIPKAPVPRIRRSEKIPINNALKFIEWYKTDRVNQTLRQNEPMRCSEQGPRP